MNISKKITFAVIAAATFATTAYASPINVGGVVFDPDYASIDDVSGEVIEQDFAGRMAFSQWYTKEATSRGELKFNNRATINTINASVNGSAGQTGFFLQGGGLFTGINEPSRSIANGSFGDANSFCPGCQVSYAFGGIGLNKNASFDLTNAWAQIYVDRLSRVSVPINSQGTANKFVDGNVWADLDFQELSFQSGTVQNGQVSAILKVMGGLAFSHFAPKTLEYTGTSFFNNNATVTNQGVASLSGNTIPEPGTIALFGLGLLGFVGVRRKFAENRPRG